MHDDQLDILYLVPIGSHDNLMVLIISIITQPLLLIKIASIDHMNVYF